SPEALFWFLCSETYPTTEELAIFVSDLVTRCELPDDVKTFCDNLPCSLPPAVQITAALSSLSVHSKMLAAMASSRTPKSDLWMAIFQDALDLITRFPMLCARLYANIYREGRDRDVPLDKTADLATNFALRLGRKDDTQFI